jgi:hypothetical protein
MQSGDEPLMVPADTFGFTVTVTNVELSVAVPKAQVTLNQ